MKNQKGFSLLELLIVVAIILIIAAIAVPSLLRARVAANSSNAASSVKSVASAIQMYNMTYPDKGYPATAAALGGSSCSGLTPATPTSTESCVLDSHIATAVDTQASLNGYKYVYTAGAAAGDGSIPTFTLTAVPVTPGQTGDRGFYVDQTGTIHYSAAGTVPTAADPILGGA
jgi:type IV pilus assembly protein PilA